MCLGLEKDDVRPPGPAVLKDTLERPGAHALSPRSQIDLVDQRLKTAGLEAVTPGDDRVPVRRLAYQPDKAVIVTVQQGGQTAQYSRLIEMVPIDGAELPDQLKQFGQVFDGCASKNEITMGGLAGGHGLALCNTIPL